jgi:hypothetical protein
VPKAVKTANELKNFLQSGKIIVKTAPAGEIEIKGTILYKGSVIATINFSPETGEVLPMGFIEHTFSQRIPIDIIKQHLENIIKFLEIGNAVSFKEPEKAWSIFLYYNNLIVGEIKIYYNGLYVIPDYVATEELRFFGK